MAEKKSTEVQPAGDAPGQRLVWEYRALTSEANQSLADAMPLLRKQGEDGWEAYQYWLLVDTKGGTVQHHWQLKRAVMRDDPALALP